MKRNVKLFSLILALLCVVSMIPVVGVSATEATEPAETTTPTKGLIDLSAIEDGKTYVDENEVSYRVVKSLEQLTSKTTLDGNVILGADIDCADLTAWTVINLNGHILDGNGYAIHGIDISVSGGLGMFSGVAGANANVIRNLTVGKAGENVKMTSTANTKGSGTLVGDINAGDITYNFENVTVYADLKVTGKGHLLGGFVGLLRKGTLNFTNCKFYGSVDDGSTNATNNPAGGFVGAVHDRSGACTVNFESCKNYATVTGATVCGGFVGNVISGYNSTAYEVKVTLQNCENLGTVSVPNNAYHAGGFIAIVLGNNGKANTNVTVLNCVNKGTVIGKHTGGYIGNITAGKAGDAVVVDIQNSSNKGQVSGSYVGGFLGVMQTGDYAASCGTIEVTMTACANEGDINGQCSGGFVGYQNANKDATKDSTTSEVYIEYCLNLGSVTGTSKSAAGFVGHIEKQYALLSCSYSANFGEIKATGNATAAGFTYRNVSCFSVDTCGSFGKVTAANNKIGILTVDFGWSAKKVTNLYYTEIVGALDLDKIATYKPSGKKTLEEGIAWMNTLENVDKVVLNTEKTGAVLATPTFAGVQESLSAADTIRLVATLNDSLNYSAVGFTVELVGGNTVEQECNSVYRKLLSTNAQGFTSEVTAEELYGTYLYALSISGIPTEGTVTLKVTPFAKDKTNTYTGDSYNVVYTNGKVVAITPCA